MNKKTIVKPINNQSFMTEKGVKNNSRSIYQDGSIHKIADGNSYLNSILIMLFPIFNHLFRSNL